MLKERFPVAGKRFLRRALAFLLSGAAALSLTGCITFLTEINVRGDGSGTMVQTITMNPGQIKESVEGVAKQLGATMSGPNQEADQKPTAEPAPEPTPEPAKRPAEGPLEEGDFKDKALDLGQGVTFVSAEKIDTKTAAGVRVTYAFKDINQLAVNPKPEAAMGAAGAGASSKDALKFRLNRLPNGNALLTVVLPGPKPETPRKQTPAPPPAAPPEEQAATPPAESSGEPDLEMSMMAMQMFKGLHMGLAVNVDGRVVKTNSPYVEGSKVTLMDIEFDKLLSDKKAFRAFNDKMGTSTEDDRKMLEALKGIQGFKVITDPEISIEFTPEKNP